MKFLVVKNMETGATAPKRRKTDIIGQYMPDPFFDSFQAEGLACYDIIGKIDGCDGEFVDVIFNKHFLHKIVRNYINFIKELETKGTRPLAHRH